jgi:hypothetical protein
MSDCKGKQHRPNQQKPLSSSKESKQAAITDLDVSIVVLTCPNEPSIALDSLSDHVVCEEEVKVDQQVCRRRPMGGGGRKKGGDEPMSRCSYQRPAASKSFLYVLGQDRSESRYVRRSMVADLQNEAG